MNRIATHRAGELVGKNLFLTGIHINCQCTAFSQTQGRFEALGQTLLDVRVDLHTVNNDVDRMFFVLFQ